MKSPWGIAAFSLLLLHGAAEAEMRVWTNTSGQLIEAELIGVNAAKRAVQVRLKSGAEFEIAIDNLSPPDKAYAKDHWVAIQNAPVITVPGKFSDEAIKSLPESFRSRFTPTTRLESIRRGGGTPEMETAVAASLKLFKTSQNPDGSWGRANKGAMTGFVLQCFLGHGETTESSEFGEAVMKGLLYLIELARKNPEGIFSSNWGGKTTGGLGGAGTYEHAIATLAVGEAYVTARVGTKSLSGLRVCFETAIKTIISQQTSKGSWAYGGEDIAYNPGGGADLSLANWHFQALDVAQATGLKIDGLDACVQKALSYIESTQTKAGGFGGTTRDAHYNQWSLSGGAAAGHLMLAEKSTPAAARGVQFITDFLKAEPPDWNKNCNLYCWHGYSNALFLNGGSEWTTFASTVMPQVLGAQQPDGSFKRGRPNWPAGDAADATYRQALCTLILETFYR
ncbi:prenyltransferase/squalene oxidase repeat-containing protein [Prosthecobacter sp.]|uniref:prenyltransferase/squalene oxidase repeat-containing protein n=1 Tax=Prosthecobacter sp. TaxID=1965333 RepID=UPI0024895BB2|nr:prenyltransferase/squalene oxidase repeat-containing protein [Prosthecobacter sp.]MDI1312990.1 terpene cyclase/mutase family protein [Prosthecobacter sp.]